MEWRWLLFSQNFSRQIPDIQENSCLFYSTAYRTSECIKFTYFKLIVTLTLNHSKIKLSEPKSITKPILCSLLYVMVLF